MPSVLGYKVSNTEKDRIARSANGYIESDIPILKELGIMGEDDTIELKDGSGNLFGTEDIQIFLNYVANNVESYPIPRILRCILEDMRTRLLEAVGSPQTAAATRSHEREQIKKIEQVLLKDGNAGGQSCRGSVGVTANVDKPNMGPVGTGINVHTSEIVALNQLIQSLDEKLNTDNVELIGLKTEFETLRKEIETCCDKKTLEELSAKINDLARRSEPWPEPPLEAPGTEAATQTATEAIEVMPVATQTATEAVPSATEATEVMPVATQTAIEAVPVATQTATEAATEAVPAGTQTATAEAMPAETQTEPEQVIQEVPAGTQTATAEAMPAEIQTEPEQVIQEVPAAAAPVPAAPVPAAPVQGVPGMPDVPGLSRMNEPRETAGIPAPIPVPPPAAPGPTAVELPIESEAAEQEPPVEAETPTAPVPTAPVPTAPVPTAPVPTAPEAAVLPMLQRIPVATSRFSAPPLEDIASNKTQDLDIQYMSRIKLTLGFLLQKIRNPPFADTDQNIVRILRDFFYVISPDTENIVAFDRSKQDKIMTQYKMVKSNLLKLNTDEDIAGMLNEIETVHLPAMFEYLTYIKNEGMYSPKDKQRNSDVTKLPELQKKYAEKRAEYERIAREQNVVRQDLRKEFEAIQKMIAEIETKWKANAESPLIRTIKIQNMRTIVESLTELRDKQFASIYKMQKRTASGDPIPDRYVGTVGFLIETAQKRLAVLEGTTIAQGDVDVSGIRTKAGRIKAMREAVTRKWSAKEKEFRDREATIARQLRELQTKQTADSYRLRSAVQERRADLQNEIVKSGTQIAELNKALDTLEQEQRAYEATKQKNRTKLNENIKKMGGKRTYKKRNRQAKTLKGKYSSFTRRRR